MCPAAKLSLDQMQRCSKMFLPIYISNSIPIGSLYQSMDGDEGCFGVDRQKRAVDKLRHDIIKPILMLASTGSCLNRVDQRFLVAQELISRKHVIVSRKQRGGDRVGCGEAQQRHQYSCIFAQILK